MAWLSNSRADPDLPSDLVDRFGAGLQRAVEKHATIFVAAVVTETCRYFVIPAMICSFPSCPE